MGSDTARAGHLSYVVVRDDTGKERNGVLRKGRRELRIGAEVVGPRDCKWKRIGRMCVLMNDVDD